MGARGWPGAERWARQANRIAPTIVGGSKKHGGGDLGPTRAKQAWAELGVDGLGIADAAPDRGEDPALRPRLTCGMVARLQGWRDEWEWQFAGRKTARYRQLGNAFPPPVAEAVGRAIHSALRHEGVRPQPRPEAIVEAGHVGDPVYAALRCAAGLPDRRADRRGDRRGHGRGHRGALTTRAVLRGIRDLSQDFEVDTGEIAGEPAYRLGAFKAFLGQHDHERHERFLAGRARIS